MTSRKNEPRRRQPPQEDALVQQALERFRQAAAAYGGPTIRRFRIGGRGVELQFAGPGLLERLTPPMDHLTAPDVDNRPFVVRLWDTASTGVKPPASVWTADAYGPRGDVRFVLGDQLQASYSVDAGMLSLFDAAAGRAVCWVRDPDRLPPWDLAAPLRPILAWWAAATEGQLAHAAAVGEHDAAVLLTAAGGSGKSTTALACLQAGLMYLGDDYVLLRPGDPPMVCSLYNTAKVTPDQLRHALPDLGAPVVHGISAHQDKVTLRLGDSHASQLVSMLPLQAILVTALAPDGRATLVPTSRGEVLKAMAPTTIFQLPAAGAGDLARLAAIVRRVSCYRLQLGSDMAANVAAVRHVIATCGRADENEP